MSKRHITEQKRLLMESVRTGLPLSEVLSSAGWTYDDLRYRQDAPFEDREKQPLGLSDVRLESADIPFVSFFSGCGGMDLGFEAAGFEQLASFEFNELFCRTIKHNRPSHRVFGLPGSQGDVSDRPAIEQVLDGLIGTQPFDGVFHGGPPCQPFSIAANQRFAKWGDNFKRVGFDHPTSGNLLFDYIHYIKRYLPRAFLIENVPGLGTVDDGSQLSKAMSQLRRQGYHVAEPSVVNAADYGIPQERKRLIVVGWRDLGTFRLPGAHSRRIQCIDALSPDLRNAGNHVTRLHKAQSVLRYMELRAGERDHHGRCDRLDPSRPSKTIIAGGTGGGGRSHLHPLIPRTLSVRECARLQTFPDDYEFLGPSARQFTQVGNAVPCMLAFYLAERMREQFTSYSGALPERVAI